MKYSEIKTQALDSYPPTKELLQSVGASIGSSMDISNAIKLGPHGPRLWRRWVSGEKPISKTYWIALVLESYTINGESIEIDNDTYIYQCADKKRGCNGKCRVYAGPSDFKPCTCPFDGKKCEFEFVV